MPPRALGRVLLVSERSAPEADGSMKAVAGQRGDWAGQEEAEQALSGRGSFAARNCCAGFRQVQDHQIYSSVAPFMRRTSADSSYRENNKAIT